MIDECSVRGLIRLAGVFLCALLAFPAQATSLLDVRIGLKTLRLLSNKPSGPLTMLVVYDPGNAASKQEAQSIVAEFGDGLRASSDVMVTASLLPVGELARHEDVKLVFVTAGLARSWDLLQRQADGMLTITTDLDCVRADRCVVGIVSQPTVEIYYSRAAAEAQKIRFSDAFAMLAKNVGGAGR